MISDKSQDELSLLIFADILLREGVKFDVVARWVADHTNTTINFKQLGMKVRTYFQRKRGDASTLHGNSRVLAVAIAWWTSAMALHEAHSRRRFVDFEGAEFWAIGLELRRVYIPLELRGQAP